MKFLAYMKDRGVYLTVNILIFLIVSFFLIVANYSIEIIIILFFIWFTPLSIYIFLEYFKINSFLKESNKILKNIDEKYLFSEIIEEPSSNEMREIIDILSECSRSMHEKVKYYNRKNESYKDYIEMWIHEVKTPIASSRLIIENNKSDITKSIDDEIKKIDYMVEQVLYYSKIDEANEDYIIKEVLVNNIIAKVIKNNFREFMRKKISVEVFEEEEKILTDEKWIIFILNQIIVNSLKYTKEGGKISLNLEKDKNSITLSIKDNGIGILKSDIDKVFKKGFTGENGRKFGKSTGIGLYICKKLCDKLRIGLKIQSEIDGNLKGTEVKMIFPRSEIRDLVKKY